MSDTLCDICDRSLAKMIAKGQAYCMSCYRDEIDSLD